MDENVWERFVASMMQAGDDKKITIIYMVI